MFDLIVSLLQMSCFQANTSVVLSMQNGVLEFTGSPLLDDGSVTFDTCKKMDEHQFSAEIQIGSVRFTAPDLQVFHISIESQFILRCSIEENEQCTQDAAKFNTARLNFRFSNSDIKTDTVVSTYEVELFNHLESFNDIAATYDLDETDAIYLSLTIKPVKNGVAFTRSNDSFIQISIPGIGTLNYSTPFFTYPADDLVLDIRCEDSNFSEQSKLLCKQYLTELSWKNFPAIDISLVVPYQLEKYVLTKYDNFSLITIQKNLSLTQSVSSFQPKKSFDCYAEGGIQVLINSKQVHLALQRNINNVTCPQNYLDDWTVRYQRCTQSIIVSDQLDFKGRNLQFTFMDTVPFVDVTKQFSCSQIIEPNCSTMLQQFLSFALNYSVVYQINFYGAEDVPSFQLKYPVQGNYARFTELELVLYDKNLTITLPANDGVKKLGELMVLELVLIVYDHSQQDKQYQLREELVFPNLSQEYVFYLSEADISFMKQYFQYVKLAHISYNNSLIPSVQINDKTVLVASLSGLYVTVFFTLFNLILVVIFYISVNRGQKIFEFCQKCKKQAAPLTQ